MDVTPPSMLRRLGVALAGLAVAALAGAACALSFDDLRALAITGEARQDLAFLYPAAFDALLVVALISVLLLRSAQLPVRLQAAIVLVLLIVAAAAANVATAVRFTFDVRQAAIGVALAPWVMLAVALWLWLLLIKHVQTRRAVAGGDEDDGTREPDIVPFHRARAAETPPPLDTEAVPVPVLEPTPVVGPTPAPETPPVPAQESPAWAQEQRYEPSVRDDDEAAARTLEAPISAQVAEWRAEEPAEEAAAQEGPAREDDDVPEVAEDVQAPLTRPVRWGDRVKPTDVLVHPRPDERDVDTQPHPVFDEEIPDPAHGPETADPAERQTAAADTADATGGPEDELGDTAPHPVIHDDAPAPSGRLRSTPRPPDD